MPGSANPAVLVEDRLTTVYSVDWVYTALKDSPTRMLLRGRCTTEIGGGAAGDLAAVRTLTMRVFDGGMRGAMVGAASFYANRVPSSTVAECATTYGIGESAGELIRHID
jgi:hypothetical protein